MILQLLDNSPFKCPLLLCAVLPTWIFGLTMQWTDSSTFHMEGSSMGIRSNPPARRQFSYLIFLLSNFTSVFKFLTCEILSFWSFSLHSRVLVFVSLLSSVSAGRVDRHIWEFRLTVKYLFVIFAFIFRRWKYLFF